MPGKVGLPSGPPGFRPTDVLSPVVVLVAALSGCLGPFPPGADGGNDSIPSPTKVADGPEKATEYASLDSVLYGLATAENRTGYATAYDISLSDGRVEVVVELEEGRGLPDEFDVEVRSRYEHLVQAFVAVDDLVPLSGYENVSYVRLPRRPGPDDPSTDPIHP